MNNLNQKLEDIVIEAIQGTSVPSIQCRLIDLAEEFDKNPFELFEQTNYQTNQEGLRRILDILAPEETSTFIEQFQSDCDKLHISPNLINFLEFLTRHHYHRLHPHIHTINKHKPILQPYAFYTLSSCVITIGGLVLMSIIVPNIWNQTLQQHRQQVLNFLIHYIWIAENITFLILLIRLIVFLTRIYWIINNHTTTIEHKFHKIIKIILVDSLVIIAKGLLYANHGYMNPLSGYLFIASSFIELAYSLWTFFYLTQPSKPDNQNLLSKSSIASLAHYYESKAYYERALGRCFHEFWGFAIVAAGTILSALFSNHILFIGILVVIFQFLISQLKDYMIQRNNTKIDKRLQKELKKIYASSSQYSMFSDAATQTENNPDSLQRAL